MTHSDQTLQDGLDALGRADFPAAIEILAGVASHDPSNAAAWRALGICYLEIREPKIALEALERSLQAEPEDADTHYVLGSACGTLGDLERAAACYRRALEFNPQHAKAEEFLIRTEALLESRDHYRRGLKLLYAAEPSREDLNQAVRELVQSAAIFEDSPARESLADCAQKLLAVRQEEPVSVETTSGTATWRRACERGFQCTLRSNWLGLARLTRTLWLTGSQTPSFITLSGSAWFLWAKSETPSARGFASSNSIPRMTSPASAECRANRALSSVQRRRQGEQVGSGVQ